METSSDECLQILIVHRDPAKREAIAACIAKAETPMAVYECEGVLDTHEVLKTAQPSCALVAHDLADGSILDLLDAWHVVPFIVLTRLGQDGREAMRRGAQDHLVETQLDPQIVERSIRYAIERKLHGRAMENLAHQDRLASLGQLAATVAHEINNPLSYIAANLETLQGQLDANGALLRSLVEDPEIGEAVRRRLAASPLPLKDDETKALVEESATGCKRIVTIVRQLGSFARKSDEDEPARETCLSDVVSWACALTERRIEQRGTLIKRLADESTFIGRPGRLAQVATNLLMNAAQALPADRAKSNTIWVSTESDEEASYLVVEDTGPGFTWSVRRRALDPFFTTKPQGEGTGLGLSIANDIIRAHGGTLTLDNRAGGGARVSVRIPRRTELATQSSLPPARLEEARSLRILLIDDEVALRRAYLRWLRPHEVVAEDATDALDRLLTRRDRAFDLILCDLTMPDISGFEVRERLSETAPELLGRFVFLTGGAVDETARHALESSSTRTLSKPATKAQILAVARSVGRDVP